MMGAGELRDRCYRVLWYYFERCRKAGNYLGTYIGIVFDSTWEAHPKYTENQGFSSEARASLSIVVLQSNKAGLLLSLSNRRT